MRIDLPELISHLRHRFSRRLSVPSDLGRARLRSAICERLSCDSTQAELLLDHLEQTGLLFYGQGAWHIGRLRLASRRDANRADPEARRGG